jgi:phage host-nuclease inhibitor protein Gam
MAPKKKTEPKLKIVPILLPTRRDMEVAFGQLASAVMERDRITAELEQKIVALREQYAPRLDVPVKVIEQHSASLLRWGLTNRAEFGDKRSLETAHGFLRFRTGQWQLKCKLKGWKQVIEKIKGFGLEQLYVRTVEEVNKEALIADRASDLLARARKIKITDLGVAAVQEEHFTIEIKREQVAEPQLVVEEEIEAEVKAA